MSHVGTGAGDYVQSTTYKYVGRGAGEFGLLQVPTSPRPNYCCWTLIPCLILGTLLLLPLLYYLMQPVTYPPTLPPTQPPTPHPYNCDVGRADDWTTSKQMYCCEKFHTGCPTPTPAVGPIGVE